jgi:hypothetical protein
MLHFNLHRLVLVARCFLFVGLLVVTCSTAFTQKTMKIRTVEELINKANPGWPLVQEWIDSAKNKVEVLPVDTAKARDALFKTQITTRSPMGAITYMTGGLLVDGGWIRILGSGHPRLNRSLPEWNKGKSFKEYGEAAPYYLIADDAMGGFFALNGGAFSKDKMGTVFYLAPDNLEWEDMDLSYTGFLNFCFKGDLQGFYGDYRWKGWQEEVAALPGDKVFNFFPPLWTKDGKNIANGSRKAVPVEEQFDINLGLRKQMGIETNYHE